MVAKALLQCRSDSGFRSSCNILFKEFFATLPLHRTKILSIKFITDLFIAWKNILSGVLHHCYRRL